MCTTFHNELLLYCLKVNADFSESISPQVVPMLICFVRLHDLENGHHEDQSHTIIQ